MEKSQLQLKALLSEDGEELGKILRIDERSGYEDQTEFLYVIRYRVNILKKRIIELPLKSYPPYDVTAESVSIDINKEEFELLIKQHETNQKMKAKAAKFAKAKNTDKAMALSFAGRL